MKTFCTIVTKSHLSWALALNESIKTFDSGVIMYILITDAKSIECSYLKDFPNSQLIYLNDLEGTRYGEDIIKKYTKKSDFMRWALKSVLIVNLLEKGFEKVIYCDCDVFFYNDYNFLWEELDTNSVLLTPHWINHQNTSNLAFIHSTGLFNGGFIGVSRTGKDAMEWWAKACLFRCDHGYGYVNVDQGYLEYLLIYFENIKIIEHKGCNVAYWNSEILERSFENGKYIIKYENKKFPLIFYHFGSSRYSQFLQGNDTLFIELLNILNQTLIKYGYSKNLLEIAKSQIENKSPITNNPVKKLKSLMYKLVPYRVYKINTKI